MYTKLNRLYKNRAIYEVEKRVEEEKELMKMMTDLVDFINSAKPNTPEEDAEIYSIINDKKNKILSHSKFEEFKEKGFTLQDETIKLSDWHRQLAKAASSYLKNKEL